MPSDKRQRQDEGRLLRLEAERVAASRSQRFRQFRTVGLLVGAVVLVALAVSLLSNDNGGTADGTTTTTVADGSPVSIPFPAPGATITGETPCPAADGSAERTTTFEQAPPVCIDAAKTYTALLKTSEGDITIALDANVSPISVNNFVVLARYHYYDGVAFHRIVPGFVNQAGDAVGPMPGEGGPGYSIPDEMPLGPLEAYVPGSVAMARTQDPNSAGSQFFLVIDDSNGALSGAGTYAVFGQITAGQDVSAAINELAVGEAPTKLVTIDSVEITET